MKVRRQIQSSLPVIGVIAVLMLLGMGTLAAVLWRLQVPQQSGFVAEFVQQSVRRVRLPAVRGKIYDTKGVCLADSVPNYCIAIYTEELRARRSAMANTLELMHEIWSRVGVPPDVTYRDVRRHLIMTPDEPLVLYRRLDDERLGRWQNAFGLWSEGRTIPGLSHHDPASDSSITIETSELLHRATTTAANTLELVYEMADRIGIPRAVTYQDIKDHIYARRPLPLMAWQHLDDAAIARWADTCSDLAGADIYCRADRCYPEGDRFAHLIGYTLPAAAASEEDGERIHFDLRGISGQSGLEQEYNDLFEGEPGSRLVQVDVSGYRYRDLQTHPPKPGGDLQLTVDAQIQRFAADALADRQDGEDPAQPVKGAVVVLDPNNGDVLAMVSSPTFDPNAYMNSKHYRQALLKDPFSRTFQRAVYGQYPPGSTFKPIVALGVLSAYPDYGETIHTCRPGYRVGRRRMQCWIHGRGSAHGDVNLRQALMYSCNIYMFEMAQAVGYGPIHDMAKQFGIGQFAGLFPELGEEPGAVERPYGSLPDEALNTIDLCNMSIGQGKITASPLQMAMAAAAIANGGTLYRPRLIKKWRTAPDAEYQEMPTWTNHRINLSAASLDLVRGGMFDVVQHPEGTARKARVPGINIAGKTGSAQYTKRVDGKVVDSVYAWMISFAPFEHPRYAVAFLVEDGVSGGNTIGPRLSELYRKIFEYDGTLPGKEEE